MPPEPDLSKLPSYTNSELKAHLRALGLSSTGKKTVLLSKLIAYYTKTESESSPKDEIARQLRPSDVTLSALDPMVPRLNMDVSALLSMISGTANSTIEELEDSAFTDPALELQVREELNDIRVLALLQSRIEGASMIICESALNSFRDIVSKIGGENEILRARDLLCKCVAVPDPREHTLSSRLLAVGTKRLGDRRNALVFATGECLGIPTITTNQAYVRSAENAGIHLNIVLFPARALSEAKRIRKSRSEDERTS